jgi:hypothetical protein
MNIFYGIAILTQLVMAFLFRNESKTAYMLYILNNLLGDKVQAGRGSIRAFRASKPEETKSHTVDPAYSLFLEK